MKRFPWFIAGFAVLGLAVWLSLQGKKPADNDAAAVEIPRTKTSRAFQKAQPVTSDTENDFRNRIARATTADFGLIFGEIASLPDGPMRRRLAGEILNKWMNDDSENLRQFILLQRGEDAAHILPVMAQAFVDDLPITTSRDSLFYAMTQTYSVLDLKAAVQWSGQIIATGRDTFPCIELFGKLTKQDAQAAVAAALQIPENPTRRFVMEHIAANWNFADTAGAFAVAEGLPAGEQTPFYREYFRAWALANPAQAAAAVTTINNPAGLAAASESVAESLAAQSPVDARNALAWADSLPDDSLRGIAAKAIYKTWSQSDPVGAVTDAYGRYPNNPELAQTMFAGAVNGRNDNEIWELAQSVIEPLRSYALRGTLQQLVGNEPVADVIARVSALPDGQMKDVSAEFLALQIGGNDLNAAQNVAKKINEPALRERTLQKLAASP